MVSAACFNIVWIVQEQLAFFLMCLFGVTKYSMGSVYVNFTVITVRSVSIPISIQTIVLEIHLLRFGLKFTLPLYASGHFVHSLCTIFTPDRHCFWPYCCLHMRAISVTSFCSEQ